MLMSGRFAVCPEGNLPEGGSLKTRAGGELVAVFKQQGKLYALADTCSHAQSSLSEGEISSGAVSCPLHGARFDLDTGQALSLPATRPVQTFAVEVENGEIVVTIP
jgi:3-phenylpropionate/trans-cinnamate dioxygenase ferredoxin component